MNKFVTKAKGLIFIIAGLIWLIAIFIKSWPIVSLNSSGAFLFLLSTICGFSVMTFGTVWLENNTNE